MHAFTVRLAQRIEHPHPDTIADSLSDALEVMRMWRFFGGDPTGSAVAGPFSETVEYPFVQSDDVERLKQALVTFVRSHPHHPELSRAIGGLQYLAASDTKDLLIEVLRDCVGRDPNALYQSILALEELGEDLYGPRSSTSFDDVERNEGVAREYLSRSGLQV